MFIPNHLLTDVMLCFSSMPEVSGIKQEAFEGLKKALLSLKVRILCKPFRHWIVEVSEISIYIFIRLNIAAFFALVQYVGAFAVISLFIVGFQFLLILLFTRTTKIKI